ncbi:hypothetical protein [Eubacterium barkeri]|uniref:SynChlorMet cassette protein ScmC n=1 Tax=Eubacterium barkeri TaxID=1528 RepID=A0A1H3HJN0_EUBBA|nr:hypothetical protein [Eubacterium barkeri]SDY15570.1 hypothetical protein SAMN04488579_1186 [Eubacterium barkeri]
MNNKRKMVICLADFVVEVNHQYSALQKQCEGYKTEDYSEVDLSVCIEPEDIHKEAESLAAYRQIGEGLPAYDALILHAAVVAVDGWGYAFLAPSGTGKSTHVALWRKFFGEKAIIVNGDKPIVRRRNGVFYAYGTPWCGKEGWQTNMGVPLAGLCFLHRGTTNRIAPVEGGSVVSALLNQVYRPRDRAMLKDTLDLLEDLLKKVPCYALWCDRTLEAAQVAYGGMVKDED